VEADTLYNIAGVTAYQDDYIGAHNFARQAYDLYHRLGHRQGELRALNVIGVTSYSQGDSTEAAAQFNRALHLSREIGERRNEGVILRNLGGLACRQGDYAGAVACLEQSLDCCRASGDRRSESETLAFLGLASHAAGDDATACKHSRQAIHLAQSVGARYEEGFALVCLGHALAGLGQLREAADAYRQALAIQRALGESNMAMEPLAGLARVALAAGNPAQALAHVEEILHHLEHHTLGGAEEPFLVYLTCYRVLLAHQDPRAGEVLDMAHTLLQEWAARITPEELQRSFLERVPAHRAIVEAWERQHVTASPG
jgi:tetratricopeptide (TPR) repeat protein